MTALRDKVADALYQKRSGTDSWVSKLDVEAYRAEADAVLGEVRQAIAELPRFIVVVQRPEGQIEGKLLPGPEHQPQIHTAIRTTDIEEILAT